MEFHIEQVLYRDQRTIKTRYFDDYRNHHHHQHQSEETKFLPQSHHQQRPVSVADDALSIQGVSKSSLYYFNDNNNCHNQYFSKFTRLFYQTEVPCDSEGAARYTEEISEKKRVRNGSWYKSKLIWFCFSLFFVYKYFKIKNTLQKIHTNINLGKTRYIRDVFYD